MGENHPDSLFVEPSHIIGGSYPGQKEPDEVAIVPGVRARSSPVPFEDDHRNVEARAVGTLPLLFDHPVKLLNGINLAEKVSVPEPSQEFHAR